MSILHSNAFTHTAAAAHELPVAVWDREMAVNLRALYLATRTFLDDLRAERGSLVATSSVHADFGLPGYPAYAAAKGGMCALVRQFAVEYGPEVRFNSVLPGPILTDVWNDVDEEDAGSPPTPPRSPGSAVPRRSPPPSPSSPQPTPPTSPEPTWSSTAAGP